jgi:subtilase family serine protease
MRARKTFLLIIAVLLSSLAAWSQTAPNPDRLRDPLSAQPIDKVSAKIDNTLRVALSGNVCPLATPANVVGEVLPDQPMSKMVLVLRPDASQDKALEELIRAQQDPSSPYFHQWLTPETFGEHFGISQNDLAQVVNWLEMQGMKVDEIPSSRRSIVFSGTAGQVETAFHTQMRKYSVRGQIHFANATNPEIPQALAEVVKGIVSLHDFRSTPAHETVPAYTLANGITFLMPKDWDTIYDVTPLYSQGLDGTGQSIAVVGRTDVALTDVETFRTNAGLPTNPANVPQKIFVNGVNPGMPDSQDETESALDVEWAGAIARNATIDFVSAQSGATDGVILAAQYAVTNNVAPIVTMSYLNCEADISGGGQSLWGSLWSQAASQGQSVFVASGDSGAAGCDASTEKVATQGKAVNAICSTPNSTCVGGTEFNDSANPGAYWSATNGAGLGSALSYIPELAWNESATSGTILASGGGISTVYPRPGWQSGPGVPAGNMRLVPDIAASSAVHDAYIIEFQGGAYAIAGTSAATPSLASVMALVLQNSGARQGNVNPALYALASQQATGGPAVFHDITSGNNSVPGVTGYNAGPGYDMVTGLGSVDAFVLVNSWSNSRGANYTLASNPSSLTVSPGSPNTVILTMSAQDGFNSAVSLSAGGAPTGITVSFSSPTITGTTSVTMAVTASSNALAGIYPITVTGTGGGLTRTVVVSLTVVAATFTLTASPTQASAPAGGSTSITLTIAKLNGFNSAVALAVRGLPTGVTGSFAPTSVTSGNSSTLTLAVASGTAAGTSAFTVTGTSGSITQTEIVTLAVLPPASFTLSSSATSASLTPGGSIPITLTTARVNGFSSAVALSVTGVPAGVTATFAPTSIASPGAGSSTLTLVAASTAAAGTSTITVTAAGGGVTKTQALSLTISGTFTLSLSATSASVAPGRSIPITLTTARVNGFSSAVALSVTGVPARVTATFAPTSIASPGAGSSTLTLAAGSTAAAATVMLTVTASGGGVTKTQTLSLTVSQPPSFTLSSSAASASLDSHAGCSA